jgi:hypothetical protein
MSGQFHMQRNRYEESGAIWTVGQFGHFSHTAAPCSYMHSTCVKRQAKYCRYICWLFLYLMARLGDVRIVCSAAMCKRVCKQRSARGMQCLFPNAMFLHSPPKIHPPNNITSKFEMLTHVLLKRTRCDAMSWWQVRVFLAPVDPATFNFSIAHDVYDPYCCSGDV